MRPLGVVFRAEGVEAQLLIHLASLEFLREKAVSRASASSAIRHSFWIGSPSDCDRLLATLR
jgi:hypothetical protein